MFLRWVNEIPDPDLCGREPERRQNRASGGETGGQTPQNLRFIVCGKLYRFRSIVEVSIEFPHGVRMCGRRRIPLVTRGSLLVAEPLQVSLQFGAGWIAS